MIGQAVANLLEQIVPKYLEVNGDCTEKELRDLVCEILDRHSNLNGVARKHWRPLTPDKKANELAKQIPDGTYANGGWAIVDQAGRVCAIDGNFYDQPIFEEDIESHQPDTAAKEWIVRMGRNDLRVVMIRDIETLVQ